MEPDLVLDNIDFKSDLSFYINTLAIILFFFFSICLYYYFKNK